ncbi:HIT-like protein [Imleria badia]|nr:HIT-like protein [Imleria badia]
MATQSVHDNCAFCKLLTDKEPSFKVDETDLSYAFVALFPLTDCHVLVIPKFHAAKMHELPNEYLTDAIALAKKIAIDHGLEDYNILQNNGRVAYQSVDHVHFHVISKPDEDSGLVVQWPPRKPRDEEEAMRVELFERMGASGKTTCDLGQLNAVIRAVTSS